MTSVLETVGLEVAVLLAAFAVGALLERLLRRIFASRLGANPTRWRKWLVAQAFRWTLATVLAVAGLHLFRLSGFPASCPEAMAGGPVEPGAP